MAAADPFIPIPNPKISAYCHIRAAHTAVVTSDWLAQVHTAVDRHLDDSPAPQTQQPLLAASPSASGKNFCVINEFNNWQKKPDLAEAVAAIGALAAVIRASEATTIVKDIK